MTWSHLGIDDYHDSSGHKTYRWWKILLPICLYCLNYTKFGQLFLRKIIKIVATRCQILRLKCTEFDFGWAPDSAGEAYSAPQDLRGLLLRGGEGGEGEGKGAYL